MAMVTCGLGGASLRAAMDTDMLGGGGVRKPSRPEVSPSGSCSVVTGEMESLNLLFAEVGLRFAKVRTTDDCE